MKTLEIKKSAVLNLIFANNTISVFLKQEILLSIFLNY